MSKRIWEIEMDNTVGSKIAMAVREYVRLHPHWSPLTALSIDTGIHPKRIERAIHNEADLSYREMERLLEKCGYKITIEKK